MKAVTKAIGTSALFLAMMYFMELFMSMLLDGSLTNPYMQLLFQYALVATPAVFTFALTNSMGKEQADPYKDKSVYMPIGFGAVVGTVSSITNTIGVFPGIAIMVTGFILMVVAHALAPKNIIFGGKESQMYNKHGKGKLLARMSVSMLVSMALFYGVAYVAMQVVLQQLSTR